LRAQILIGMPLAILTIPIGAIVIGSGDAVLGGLLVALAVTALSLLPMLALRMTALIAEHFSFADHAAAISTQSHRFLICWVVSAALLTLAPVALIVNPESGFLTWPLVLLSLCAYALGILAAARTVSLFAKAMMSRLLSPLLQLHQKATTLDFG
jgi:ABC-type uncharacterized transport system permease subunit